MCLFVCLFVCVFMCLCLCICPELIGKTICSRNKGSTRCFTRWRVGVADYLPWIEIKRKGIKKHQGTIELCKMIFIISLHDSLQKILDILRLKLCLLSNEEPNFCSERSEGLQKE